MPTSWIALHLTERCGLRCIHCLRDPSERAADLPVATVDRLLAEAVRVYGIDHVALTGGEPTAHPDLEGVVRAVVVNGLEFHLVTSGLGFERLVKLVDGDPAARAALTRVNVSVDGAAAATHDAIRGVGAYRRALTAIAASRARDIPVAVQMTVNALNEAEIERAGLAAAELGVDRFLVGMVQATGTPEDGRLGLPRETWERIAERVDRLSGVLRIEVVRNEGFPRRQGFHTCAPFAGEILHVDPHGRLSLCCQHSGVPGDAGELAVDLAGTSLAAAHAQLLDVVHRYQRERLAAMDAGALEAWDLFPCNACLRRFGKPHWTEQGAAGPRAKRAGPDGRGTRALR